jgi:hypothetical protein
MPIDLSALIESFQRGFSEIPTIAIALGLLAGPTVALIGYRLVGVARRPGATTNIEAAPFWVCHDCRSINELRAGRCYHCGLGRDTTPEIEVLIDAPVGAPTAFDVPAGSPFAALGGNADAAAAAAAASGPGVPVMGDATAWTTGVPVGPGTASHAAIPVVAEGGDALLMANTPAADDTGEAQLTPAVERNA